ncbi:MAG: bacitracin ABC transporter ATP-binding protein [Candidatus Cloacimonetes bacterium HGW-Cloacimonetes-3]|nr:MAG: bacitracin ABC transporter ATP-binding protein [Candidatus Cloacimonetes bacterium HGW-Cloacimonetes-3]
MKEIITTDNLTKHFGSVHAVEGVSLSVRKGEIYGFLGLNGAGKTTTIRMLLGMISPSAGKAYIDGKLVSAGNYRLWSEVGYIVETPYSYPDLNVRENLELIRVLRKLPDRSCVDKVMKTLHLTEYADRKARHLSLGNVQRLGLAKALLHNPNILILDEPTNGLDPVGIVETREMLLDISANHGVTVFISSHILGEISRIASRIGIIHEGKLVQEMNHEHLEKLSRKRLLVNTLDHHALKQYLQKQAFSYKITMEGQFAIADKTAVAHPEIVAQQLVEAGIPPTLLKVDEEDLESYFLRIIDTNGDVL